LIEITRSNSSVVENGVQATGALLGQGNQGDNVRFPGHVAMLVDDPPGEFDTIANQAFPGRVGEVSDDDAGPLPREGERSRAPHPVRSAGYDSRPVCEPHRIPRDERFEL
jgi:hypothetical protein